MGTNCSCVCPAQQERIDILDHAGPLDEHTPSMLTAGAATMSEKANAADGTTDVSAARMNPVNGISVPKKVAYYENEKQAEREGERSDEPGAEPPSNEEQAEAAVAGDPEKELEEGELPPPPEDNHEREGEESKESVKEPESEEPGKASPTKDRTAADEAAGLARYAGKWWHNADGREMAEIVGNVLTWASTYSQPHADLALNANGDVEMDMGGEIFTGVIVTDGNLVWSDGDVWTRTPPQ